MTVSKGRLNVMILAAGIFFAICNQVACANCNPMLGRWMEEDPIGQPSILTTDFDKLAALRRSAVGSPDIWDVTKTAERAAMAKIAQSLGRKPSMTQALWRYSDGMDLYQYELSNPANYLDPSGEVNNLQLCLACAICIAADGGACAILCSTKNCGGWKPNPGDGWITCVVNCAQSAPGWYEFLCDIPCLGCGLWHPVTGR